MMHTSIAASYADLLAGLGVPVEAGLERARLPVAAIVEGKGFVPCRQLFAWISDAGRRHGIDDFGLRAVKRTGLAGLQTGLVTDIAESPTLLAGMHLLCRRVGQTSSHASMWIEEEDDGVRVCLRGSFSADTPGQSEMVWWALGCLCNVARLFAGPVWVPKEVGVVGSGGAGDFAENLFCVPGFATEQPYWWIALPRYMLAYPRHHLIEPPKTTGARPEDPPSGFAAAVRHLLRLYRGDGFLRPDEMADVAGFSVPELEQQLATEGQTYSRLVDETRFELARERLADTTMPIDDVAVEAGYGGAEQLSRAFRRFAGMSASEYRALRR